MMSPSSLLRVSAAPRAYLFTSFTRRQLSSARRLRAPDSDSPFSFRGGPAPPRLPKEEQEIFEALQRQSTGAFSTPRATPQINQSPDSDATESRGEPTQQEQSFASAMEGKSDLPDAFDRAIPAQGEGEELHADIRRGAQPEFEGDVNPMTGEVGGPKNEPLRWGAAGEWSYNGRTTDF